jgi:hypothetical protein
MKEQICEHARDNIVRDKQWKLHAAQCVDCHELLAVSDWMGAFASVTPGPQSLPSPGYLIFKSRLKQKQAAAQQASLPYYLMVIVSALVFAIGSVWMLVAGDTPIASIMANALVMLIPGIAVLSIGIVIAGSVYAAAAYAVSRYKNQ